MMSTKALARTMWILIAVIIILAAGLIGTVVYFTYKPPGAELPTPEFVTDNRLVYESGATYQWLDPHVSYYQYDYWILWHTVEMLLWNNGSSPIQIVPWLAESYTKINDLRYEFKLRQGIKFQDGTPLNSTAVWFSLNRLLIMDGRAGSEESYGSQAAWIVQQLTEKSLFWYFTGNGTAPYIKYDEAWVKKVLDLNFVERVSGDPYTFYLNLRNPLPIQFPYLLAGPWAGIISPTSAIKSDYQHAALGPVGTWDGNYTKYFMRIAGRGDTSLVLPQNGWKIGTGPYTLDSVDPDTYRIVLKSNSEYWGGPTNVEHKIGGVPKIATIEYLYQPSLTTRLLDLKAGKATAIAVAALDIYQVADRDKWVNEGVLESIVEGATVHGPFKQFTTIWINFNTNVTDAAGKFKKFQPMADGRIRLAIAHSVNMTDLNININNNLGIVTANVVPPDTVPVGSYNATNKPSWYYNETIAEQLLVDAWRNPLKSSTSPMHFYNGTVIPADVVDNTLSETNVQTIEMYYAAGATNYERVLATIAENLNRITQRTYNPTTGARDPEGETLGLRFVVVPVPGGQQYTLASMHQVYVYVGGWIADYNHVLNWLGPMYISTGTYFSWNYWNITAVDDLYDQAVAADKAGNVAELLRLNDKMNKMINDLTPYMWLWYPTLYYVRSSWLKGWYSNSAFGVDIWSSMYYEKP